MDYPALPDTPPAEAAKRYLYPLYQTQNEHFSTPLWYKNIKDAQVKVLLN